MYYPCEECFGRWGKEYTPECDDTCDYAKEVKQKKEMLHKIALKISSLCEDHKCPFNGNCDVYSDKMCIEQITNLLKEIVE